MSRELLQDYLSRGMSLVLFDAPKKGPGAGDDGWKERVYTLDDYNEGTHNVGIKLGLEIEPGKFLHDVDLDWPQGAPMAAKLLPATKFGFGRGARKITHAFYTSPITYAKKAYEDIIPYADGKKCTLVELRGTTADGNMGHQTMVPPSRHPSGDIVTMAMSGDIGHVETGLDRAVCLYAIACLLLRRFGPSRAFLHDTRLALAGFLMQNGCTEEETLSVCVALAEASKNDPRDAALAVQTTAERITKAQKTQGGGALAKALGEDGQKVISKIREWLGHGDFVINPETQQIVANNQDNIALAIERMNCALSYDLFSEQMMVQYGQHKPTVLGDHDASDLRLDIQKIFRFLPLKDYFFDVVSKMARANSFHPVRDWLDALQWDGIERIDTWLTTFGKAADTPYTRAVGAIVLTAAVRRVRQPGCKFDELLVLESEQGAMKSSAIRALCPDENWFSDDLPLDVDAKQIIERTAGKWIIEAAELSGMRASAVEHLKASLSRQTDGPVRKAYGRLSIEKPRQFISIGTTNAHAYLSDSTGGRRFWPVRIEVFDVAGLLAVRDQLWAEASERERSGASIRLPSELYDLAGVQQERRRSTDPWESTLAEAFPEEYQRLTPDHVWNALNMSIDRRDERGQRRIVVIMQRLGYRSSTVRDVSLGKAVKGWARGLSQRDAQRLLPGVD